MIAPLRILLADNQVPWDTDAENERTKAEIRREFMVVKPWSMWMSHLTMTSSGSLAY